MTNNIETLLAAIRDDQYTDGDQGPGIDVWAFSVMMTLTDAGIPKASHGGIVSAAVQQGLVRASGGFGRLTDDGDEDDSTLCLTAKGFEAIGPRVD